MNINMKLSKMFGTAVFTLLSVVPTMAQTTMDDMLYLTVNENIDRKSTRLNSSHL